MSSSIKTEARTSTETTPPTPIPSGEAVGELGKPLGQDYIHDVEGNGHLVNSSGDQVKVGDQIISGNRIYEVAGFWQRQFPDGHAVTYVRLSGPGPNDGVSTPFDSVRKYENPVTKFVDQSLSSAETKVYNMTRSTISEAEGLWNRAARFFGH